MELDHKKELPIIILCILGAAIGPIILINARFKISFIISGIVFSIVSWLLYNAIIMIISEFNKIKVNKVLKLVISMVLGILSFLTFFLYHYWYRVNELFKISLTTGLANFIVIVLFSILIFIYHEIRGMKGWAIAYNLSSLYYLPITIMFFLSYILPSSEGKVLLVNVAILYFSMKSFDYHME